MHCWGPLFFCFGFKYLHRNGTCSRGGLWANWVGWGWNLGHVFSAHEPQSVSLPHHPAENLYLWLLVAPESGLPQQVRHSWSARGVRADGQCWECSEVTQVFLGCSSAPSRSKWAEWGQLGTWAHLTPPKGRDRAVWPSRLWPVPRAQIGMSCLVPAEKVRFGT